MNQLYQSHAHHHLDDKIRYGSEPNNPALIHLWLTTQLEGDFAERSVCAQRLEYERQFYLLLEAIVDDLVPVVWRRMCLDNIYQPLSALQRLASDNASRTRVRQLLHELAVNCRYVEPSLNRLV